MSTDARGMAATLGAFMIWGLSPVFWKLLLHVPAMQLLAHRVLWAALFLAVLLLLRRGRYEIRRVLTSGRVLFTLALSTSLIAANWLTYIWAVLTERVLEASLGYYTNPLVTVFLAMIFLKERLNRAQALSLLLAAGGVAFLVWRSERLPWIAVVLAFTFGFYSLLRKKVDAGAEEGLLVETGALAPLALLWLVRSDWQGEGAFVRAGLETDVLLAASGLVTALPLVLFTYGARRLELVTVGFLQFLAPTLQFALAVLLYREPFTSSHFGAFLLIWTAVSLFSWDLRLRWKHGKDSLTRISENTDLN